MKAEYKTPAAVKKALRAGKKSTGDWKASKSAQVPGLSFKDSFEPKPGYWGGRCHSCPNLTKKALVASWGQWILWPGQPKHSQNHPGLAGGWRTTGPRKSGLPAQKIVILRIISCGAKLRERAINSLITSWPPLGQRSQRLWPTRTGRSSSAPARGYSLGIEAAWRPEGI